MKCYYEELGIARDANDGDIKTAYRKLALRWHPDKNPDNLVEAKEKFQTLQQAYEVLSDPHERAWYDNHREQILRGKNSDYEENCLDLFQYFTVSCFKGYGDDDKGFYKTYAEVFEKISAEDAEFMDDDEEIYKIPKFGDSTSSYDDIVGPFYAYWQSYCTKKTYTWLCPHDITEIKDRRVLRYIEKDMKKIVQKAKRERNEEVRNLVSFIRKRDKRVQANKKLLEEKAVLNRMKQEQNRLEQIRKRNREIEEMRKANGNASNKDYEDKLKLLEQDYGESIDSDDDEISDTISDGSEDIVYLGDLYCIACNKTFTNANAFLNHETSKKHKDNIERLKREMQDEEKSFEDSADQEKQKIHIVELDDLDELDDDFDELTNGLEDLDSELDELVEKLEDLSDEFDELDIEKEEVVVEVPKTKTKKNKKGKKAPKVKVESEELEVQATEAPVVIDHFIIPNEIENEKSGSEWGNVKKSTKKSKNKKAQKKSVPDVLPQVETIQQPAEKPLQKDGDCATHSCVTCKSTFPSKNKLFAHLKKTNHGVYIPKTKPQEAQTQTASKKTKGKRK